MNNRKDILLKRDYILNMIMRCKEISFIDYNIKKLIDEIEVYKDNYLDGQKTWDEKAHLAGMVEVLNNWRNSLNEDTDEDEAREYLAGKLNQLNI